MYSNHKDGNSKSTGKLQPIHPTVKHRYTPDMDERLRRWNDLLVFDFPEEYMLVYHIYDPGLHNEITSDFLHVIAFLESCVNRLAVVYVRGPGRLSWAVIDDAMYEEVCREFGFNEDSFERER